ncbi:MAG: glycosyltransferase [Candidatus Micrarchaeia archaeon]|jgi:glycosyltransferase involved in cell wall biosynthesis
MEASVIIPALNEEKYIGYVFEGLKKQSFKDFEVIVADGGSTDRTREIANKYGARVVVERRKGIARGRNAGARVAKGRILVFIDADTKPSRRLIELYVKALNGDVVAATGPILPLEKTSKSMELGYKFVSIFFVKLSIKIGRPTIVGSNFAVRKDAFEKAGGFDNRLMTYEDWDLSKKLKKYGKIKYINEAIVYTSARRIFAWSMHKFFRFHVGNIIRYNLFKKPKEEYEPIR